MGYTHLFFVYARSESQPSFDWPKRQVVWWHIHRGKEVSLGLAVSDTVSSYHIPRMHMAWDGRDLLLQLASILMKETGRIFFSRMISVAFVHTLHDFSI